MLNEGLIANLKAVDPDRYRSALFADKAGRERLLTLYAFHAELAKVPELVSEPMLGEIRYQWWRDCVEEIYAGGTVRKHEVATPLTDVLRESAMPRFWVDRLIDGRARDLDPQPFANVDAARGYSAQTSGVLMQMAVHVLGGEADDGVLAAGEAWGLTGIARSWRYYTNGMLSEINFADVCAAAKGAHNRASQETADMAAPAFPAIAYAALVPPYLKRLSKTGFEPEKDAVSYTAFAKQTRLLGAVLRGKL